MFREPSAIALDHAFDGIGSKVDRRAKSLP